MKLNIKNVYKLFLVGGTILLLNYLLWNLEELWKDFILSLGSGFFSASLLALFVDCINTKNEKAKHKELRKSFLLNISYGILFIAKGVVEKNNQRQMLQTRFYDVFKYYIQKIENDDAWDLEQKEYAEKKEKLMKSLLHGISACYSNCESILKNKYALIINNVFTKKEIDAIEYLYERCGEIQEQDVICEIGENIRMMIQEAYDYIGEIRIKLDQIIVIRNDRIENWKSLIG